VGEVVRCTSFVATDVTVNPNAVGEPGTLTIGMFIGGIWGVGVTGEQEAEKPTNKMAKMDQVICVRIIPTHIPTSRSIDANDPL
jgi:hypothetical protein